MIYVPGRTPQARVRCVFELQTGVGVSLFTIMVPRPFTGKFKIGDLAFHVPSNPDVGTHPNPCTITKVDSTPRKGIDGAMTIDCDYKAGFYFFLIYFRAVPMHFDGIHFYLFWIHLTSKLQSNGILSACLVLRCRIFSPPGRRHMRLLGRV